MTNIILCGGNGTRLWPLSRTLMPKQFLKLFEGESLFQKTLTRNQKISSQQCIVSNTEQYFLAMDQVEELCVSHISYLLEPIGRNTAPAIALACLALKRDEIVLVTPSDHLIEDEKSYLETIKQAEALAREGNLVTFGIRPEYAEIGFGYIEAEGLDVKAFHEKPDATRAQMYVNAGNYYWNSGMFCFKAGIFLDELKVYAPDIFNASLKAYKNAKQRSESIGGIVRISHEDMMKIPKDSIDYAVMEKSKNVKVLPSDIGWSDLGNFESLESVLPSNKSIIEIDAENNFIVASKKVAMIDVEDLIVVDTPDALLVSKKGASQKVKEVVEQLHAENSELPNMHLTGYRPWGTYTILDESKGYKVKRIVVKPGERLSLQKHQHRSEHWVVVSGTALVTRGKECYAMHANESTFIPIGEVHRLENAGKIPLVMIEAQVGEYVGEDDIIRLEDDYKRTENHG